MVAARMATMGEGRPSKTGSIDLVSQEEAADMVKVSVPSLQRAKKVQAEAVPEVVALVD